MALTVGTGKAKVDLAPPLNIEGKSPSSFARVAKALDINDIIKTLWGCQLDESKPLNS